MNTEKSVAVENAHTENKDNLNLLPHLESLERMMKLPVVGAAWQQSQGVYEKVKSHNRMFNWAFNTAEDAVHRAVNTAAPIVSKFDRPIQYVDQTLVKGIDKLEVTAPIIKEPPQEIYNQAKIKVIDAVQPHISKVCALRAAGQQKASSLKDLSWQKANEVLATQYGSIAVSGVDQTSALAERLLDYFFPKSENDIENEDGVQQILAMEAYRNRHPTINEKDLTPISAADDPVLHTVQTVGLLSNKVARRVYRSVSRQIKELKKEDVHDYVASLIAVLRLTQYLNFINERVQGTGPQNPALPIENVEKTSEEPVTPAKTISPPQSNNSTPDNHSGNATDDYLSDGDHRQ